MNSETVKSAGLQISPWKLKKWNQEELNRVAVCLSLNSQIYWGVKIYSETIYIGTKKQCEDEINAIGRIETARENKIHFWWFLI